MNLQLKARWKRYWHCLLHLHQGETRWYYSKDGERIVEILCYDCGINFSKGPFPPPSDKNTYYVWAEREMMAGYMQVGIPVLANSKEEAIRTWRDQAEAQRRRLFDEGDTFAAVQLNGLTGVAFSIELISGTDPSMPEGKLYLGALNPDEPDDV